MGSNWLFALCQAGLPDEQCACIVMSCSHCKELVKLVLTMSSIVQEADREIQELLAWMRQEEGASDDEEADMLMALAEQAGPTPRSQNQRSSQQVGHLAATG